MFDAVTVIDRSERKLKESRAYVHDCHHNTGQNDNIMESHLNETQPFESGYCHRNHEMNEVN